MATQDEKVRYLARIKYPLASVPGHPDRDKYMAYLSELNAKPAPEIDAMYQGTAELREKARAHFDESQRFYNRRDARADLQHWAAMSVWTVDQATALSFGKEPSVVNWDAVNSTVQLYDFSKQYEKRLNVFFSAFTVGDIPNAGTGGVICARPRAYIEWGEPRGIRFPNDLIALLPPLPSAATTPSPAPQKPTEAAIPAVVDVALEQDGELWRKRFTPKVATPMFPTMSRDELAALFKTIKRASGSALAVDWKKATEESTRNRLHYVRREKIKGAWWYDPEGVALWLHWEHNASPADLADRILRKCGMGDEWGEKETYWEGIKDGKDTLRA